MARIDSLLGPIAGVWSIRRLLKGREHNWEIEYVTDGHAALRLVGSTPTDVIVSDVHMGIMGGGRLLAAVQERLDHQAHRPEVQPGAYSGLPPSVSSSLSIATPRTWPSFIVTLTLVARNPSSIAQASG